MLSEREQALKRFVDHVKSQAKRNLTIQRKNASKKLYNSIDSEYKVMKNSIRVSFSMEDYGYFQDKGVRGANPSKVSQNARIQGQQAPNSEFKFGSGNMRGTFGMFKSDIEIWARRKNIRFRDESGRYKSGNYKSIAQVIASNIYNRGLKPSLFFTKPFEKAFKNLPDEMVESFGLDAVSLFDTIMKENFKK